MTASGDCRAYESDFRGWSACVLENDLLRLVAVPDIGGRVMALDLGPYATFFVDPDLAGKLFTAADNMGDGSLAAWKNYGGDKTWPAPQGWDNEQQWHGPPDPVLDTGRYAVDLLAGDGDQATVRMISPPDPHTGVQITRQFTLRRGSSQVFVDLAFTNVKETPIRWGIWDVVQLRAEQEVDGRLRHDSSCKVTTPVNPESRFKDGFQVMFGAQDNPQWQVDPQHGLFVAEYQWEIGKVGLDSQAGWIAFSQGREGYAFVERFETEAGAEYPDDGATVECWTVGAGQVANLDYAATSIYLMETEVLAPLRTIAPGASTTFQLVWDVCLCPGPIRDVTPAGCVGQPLSITKLDGGYCRVQGQFGVHAVGDLALLWLDGRGHQIESVSAGPATPRAAVLLDCLLPIPPDAAELELRLTNAVDHVDKRLAIAAV